MAAFFGMRGSGDWGTNQAPEDWEQLVLREFPNGMAPIYAMSSMMRTENVKSSTYHWQNKTYPIMGYDVVANSIYINATLANKYVRATHQATIGIAGGVVYVKIDNTDADNDLSFARENMKILLRDSDRPRVDVVGLIRDVVLDGANSYLAVELNEADDNDTTATTYNLTTVDRAILMGSSYPEGSTPPPGLVYDPTEYENFSEIHRDTFEETRTGRSEELRYGQGYQDDKLDCLEFHSRGWENDFLWGVKRSKTASNGKTQKFAMGCVEYIRTYAPSTHYADFRIDHASDTWLAEGKGWLNDKLRLIFRYLGGEAMCICGDGFVQALLDLAELYGNIQLDVGQRDYGIETTVWRLPFGRLHLKTHPLFSIETTNEYSGIVLHPRNFRKVYLVNNGQSGKTRFQNDLQVPGLDGTHEGFLTEGGAKFYQPNQWLYLTSVGLDGPSA